MNFVTISNETARRAYMAISFDPEKRTESTVKEFNESLQSDYEDLKEKAISEPQNTVNGLYCTKNMLSKLQELTN